MTLDLAGLLTRNLMIVTGMYLCSAESSNNHSQHRDSVSLDV